MVTGVRRKRLRPLAALALGCAGVAAVAGHFTAGPSSAEVSGPTGVILVSWDGARYDTLKELLHWQPIAETPRMCPGNEDTPARMPQACGEYWSCLPTICDFEIIESHVVSGKTLTRVQHASMLTGAPPEETTIHTQNGSSSVPYGLTIYERLRQLVSSDMTFAHVGSHRYTVRGILGWVDGTLIPSDNIRTRGHPDKFTGTGSNTNFLPLLQQFEGKPFFAFQHQKGIDMSGHGVGDQSLQYRVAMVAADDRLKELLDEIERLGFTERTHVFVTTDHGFWHNQHLGIRPVVGKTWIASQRDKLSCYTRGNVIDVVPTILDVFGANLAASNPPLRGRSLLDRERVGECIPPVCGNGIVEVGEDCEAGIAIAETCESQGFLRGDLTCSAICEYDTSDCADQLAITKLSISPATDGGVDVNMRMADRDRGGPKFDAGSDAVTIEVLNGAQLLWEGGTDNYDPSWRVYGESNSWTAARGTRPDGLVLVNMSAPVRRMKMQINAGSISGMGDFLSATALRTIIRAGSERFDANLACHVSRDQTGLRCSYTAPEEARAHKH